LASNLAGTLAGTLKPQVFLKQGLFGFNMGWADRDTCHSAHLHTLWFIKMTDAFGALVGVYLIDFRPEVDRLIGTLRFTHIAIDAFIGDQQSHQNLT
jgi:hypothetical protein